MYAFIICMCIHNYLLLPQRLVLCRYVYMNINICKEVCKANITVCGSYLSAFCWKLGLYCVNLCHTTILQKHEYWKCPQKCITHTYIHIYCSSCYSTSSSSISNLYKYNIYYLICFKVRLTKYLFIYELINKTYIHRCMYTCICIWIWLTGSTFDRNYECYMYQNLFVLIKH